MKTTADQSTVAVAEQYVAQCQSRGMAPKSSRGKWANNRIGCRMRADGRPSIYHDHYVAEDMDDNDMRDASGSQTRVTDQWPEERFGDIPAATVARIRAALSAAPTDAEQAELVESQRYAIERAVRSVANFRKVPIHSLDKLWANGKSGKVAMYVDGATLVWRDGPNTWVLADAALASEAVTLAG